MATGAIDNLRHGADVYTTDGQKVGTLHAIVLDPSDNQVTHIAVNTGPHFPEPGFGDPKIVSVDMDALDDATDERVDLSLNAATFRALPLYEQTYFYDVPDDEEEGPHPAGGRLWSWTHAIAATLASLGGGIVIPAEQFRKASFERHILNDAPVWRIEPNTHIGDVDRVLVDEATDEIEALVIRRGALLNKDVILPMQHVREIRDGLIHAQLSDEDLQALEEYRE